MKTPDFSFASEDFTGEMNELIAQKKRKMHLLHELMSEPMTIEELKIIDENSHRSKSRLRDYAPLIFEEAFIKSNSAVKPKNAFELAQEEELLNP